MTCQSRIKEKNYTTRRKEEKQVILNHYTGNLSRFGFQNNLPKKGLYNSFEQFKRNKPTVENFLIRDNNNEPSTLFSVDDMGNQTLERNAWGFCDGKDMYILENSLLFKLFRNENAFYWLVLKSYDQKTYGAPAAVPLGGGWAAVGLEKVASDVKIRLIPKLLNLTTGEEY